MRKKQLEIQLLKEFIGTLDQFTTKEKLENLIKTAGQAQVASLTVKKLTTSIILSMKS